MTPWSFSYRKQQANFFPNALGWAKSSNLARLQPRPKFECDLWKKVMRGAAGGNGIRFTYAHIRRPGLMWQAVSFKVDSFQKAKKGNGRGRGLISFGGNIPNGQNLMVIGQGTGNIADKSWNYFEPASSNRWLVQWFLHMTPYTFPLQSLQPSKISETH